MAHEQLKLSNQLCFPVYAASRLITREYQVYLDELGITYPQYLALMVLWENDGLTVNEVAQRLVLNTNTITPLLKRMEHLGLLSRKRSELDERKVIVLLTNKGKEMEDKACLIPQKLVDKLAVKEADLEELLDLKNKLHNLIAKLSKKK